MGGKRGRKRGEREGKMREMQGVAGAGAGRGACHSRKDGVIGGRGRVASKRGAARKSWHSLDGRGSEAAQSARDRS